LLEEMAWMAHDFAEERRFKVALARRVSKEVMRYHQARRTREEREARKEEQRLRRQAATIAREVLAFWQAVEKLVRHKHQTRLDQRKRKALDKHLDFLVGQTERYSTMLAGELAPAARSQVPAGVLFPPFPRGLDSLSHSLPLQARCSGTSLLAIRRGMAKKKRVEEPAKVQPQKMMLNTCLNVMRHHTCKTKTTKQHWSKRRSSSAKRVLSVHAMLNRVSYHPPTHP